MRQRRRIASAPQRQPNLYQVLQVSPGAPPEVIHAAYRALIKTHHPDVNPASEASQEMRQIIGAHAVLSDPERRSRYDAECARAARVLGHAPLPRPPSIHSPQPRPLSGGQLARPGALTAASSLISPNVSSRPIYSVRAALVLF